jgi:zinc protease
VANRGVTDAELAWAKDNIIGSTRLELATNAGFAGVLAEDAFYGLGLDYIDRLPAIIRGITRAQVNAAARRYLTLDRMALIVAGPPVKNFPAGNP